MIPKMDIALDDFSAGELDPEVKRTNQFVQVGSRVSRNWRILNTKKLKNRPGRSALFPSPNGTQRIEDVTMSFGHNFKLCFGFAAGTGTLTIKDSSGATVATFNNRGSGASLPWTLATLNRIVYCQIGLAIFLTFPGMRPQVVTWDGVSAWSIADYVELTYGNQKRTLFYRLTKQGVTLVPSATTGTITLTASEKIFTAAHVNTRMRWAGRQVLITAVTAPPSLTATAIVEETLNTTVSVAGTVDPRTQFSIGDVVTGATSGAKGIVASFFGSLQCHIILTTGVLFANGSDPNEDIVGPAGVLHIVATNTTIIAPESTTFFDDEVMNDMRGYPQSCFADQFRLGFCDFPVLPGAISWSAINIPNDQYVGPNPADAIFEVAPDKVRVMYVVPGPESSEFVFCDKKLYYIQINASNPLKPGSVSFQNLSGDGVGQVQPRVTQEVILYVNAGGNSMMGIVATGAYNRPFNTKNLSEFHAHLFSNIVAIAVPNADGDFNERYAYVLNADGSLIVGKYTSDAVKGEELVGWGPWTGAGAVTWVSALAANVLITASYFGFVICEIVDDGEYLDAAVSVNSLPAPFAAPPGMGPLWWIAGQSVFLMDQQNRPMGVYQVDGNGNIIPQGVGGEDLTAATLVAGQPWTALWEPFIPHAAPGANQQQRMRRRKVAKALISVQDSSGFSYAGRRVPAYFIDEDPTKPPMLREDSFQFRPRGRDYDPRKQLVKDTPGPLTIIEVGIEATV